MTNNYMNSSAPSEANMRDRAPAEAAEMMYERSTDRAPAAEMIPFSYPTSGNSSGSTATGTSSAPNIIRGTRFVSQARLGTNSSAPSEANMTDRAPAGAAETMRERAPADPLRQDNVRDRAPAEEQIPFSYPTSGNSSGSTATGTSSAPNIIRGTRFGSSGTNSSGPSNMGVGTGASGPSNMGVGTGASGPSGTVAMHTLPSSGNPSGPSSDQQLLALIQSKGNELKPQMYPGLTDAQINTLWDNFGNANPILRSNYMNYIQGLFIEHPQITDANAIFILNSGANWLINAAATLSSSLGTPAPVAVAVGGKSKRKTRSKKKRNQ